MLEQLKFYRPTWPYVSLFLAFFVVFIWKSSGLYWNDEISGHLSNFALTGMLLLIFIGPKSFENVGSRDKVFGISLLLAFANIIVESLNISNIFTSSTFNTPDLTDALFGIIAILLIVIVYWLRVSKRKSTS